MNPLGRANVSRVLLLGGVAILALAVVMVGFAASQVRVKTPQVLATGTIGQPIDIPLSQGRRGYVVAVEIVDGQRPLNVFQTCTTSDRRARLFVIDSGAVRTIEGARFLEISTLDSPTDRFEATVTCRPDRASPTARVVLTNGAFQLPGGPLLPLALAVICLAIGISATSIGLAMRRRQSQ